MRRDPEISRDAFFERVGYKPHSDVQADMHHSDARFRIARCGRRWGKSKWAGHEAAYRMFLPDSVNWICGPTYRLGEKEFRVAHDDFKKLGLLPHCSVHYNTNQGDMRIHFKELNSLLEVVSAERPNSLVGEGLDSVCMSEAAKHNMSTWQMYIEPALSDKRGCADFPSTPQGFNWFKGLYDVGQTDDPNYASWHRPTWTNPVNFPGGYDDPEMVRIRNTVSEMYWLQEYGAEFTAFEGLIYDEFDEDIHVKPVKYDSRLKNWWALDFGFTDPFVCLDVMIDPSDRVYVWREYQVSGKSTTDHGLVLKNRESPDGFHVNGIAADPRGADEIATLTWVLGGINHNAIGWSQGIEAIKRALKVREDGRPGLIIDPSCINLIRQIKTLRKKQTPEGHNEKPGQHDYDDHGPDALRYFFNEYFVLGAGNSLSDVYNGQSLGSEAAGFFTYTTGIRLNDRVPY
jgi:hypothetical protein